MLLKGQNLTITECAARQWAERRSGGRVTFGLNPCLRSFSLDSGFSGKSLKGNTIHIGAPMSDYRLNQE